MGLFIRPIFNLVMNMVAIYLASRFVNGFELANVNNGALEFVESLALFTLVFGIVFFVVKFVLKIATSPILILTLGLFVFVVNAIALWVSTEISNMIVNQELVKIDSFVSAFQASFIISLFHFVLHFFDKK